MEILCDPHPKVKCLTKIKNYEKVNVNSFEFMPDHAFNLCHEL